jgi:sugar transferase (PEP-CTERM/EpsH1 system associated)
MSPIRILHVVHSLEVGGLENGLVNLLNALDPERFEHSVCCLTKSGKFAERIASAGIKIVELDLPAGRFRFPLFRLAGLFREISPHIIHSRGWATVDATFAARLAPGAALIHGEHGRDLVDKNGDNWKRNQIRRLVGFNVDRYVVVCDFFRSWLSRTCGVAAHKIVHIPNGVDTNRFYPKAGCSAAQDGFSNADWKRTLNVSPEAVILGSIGRLDPVKDFPTLLKGFAEISRQHPEAVLVIVGDGPIRADLVRISNEYGLGASVKWLGERRDIPALLRQFDLFVQTSAFEGMSNTILEAMASGLPVVATDTGGNAELVKNGENGALIPVADVSALIRALGNYLRNPALRTGHGAQSRRRAQDDFDLSKMVACYSELYESVKLRQSIR